jgi:Mn-dependent DtxR family transcriptional regulator
MAEEVRGNILKLINSTDEELSVKDLSDKLNYAYSTVLKWVDILYAEGKIQVRDFGNIKLVKKKENAKEKNN